MTLTIEEQKKCLSERLYIEDLRFSDENKEIIKEFSQATKGNNIENYLINNAWDDDKERNTKAFLIRDKVTNEIVFYFAINCGILYSDTLSFDVSPEEKECLDRYIYATIASRESGPNDDDVYQELNDAIKALSEVANSEGRLQILFNFADEEIVYKEDERVSSAENDEEEYTQQVYKTFPAIDIKFLGRNGKYKPAIKLSFKLGVFVFWEIIVPHILEIAKLVGCKYIYLFAADNSDDESEYKPISTMDLYYGIDEDEQEKKEKNKKLVNYYINELKFHNVTQYKILKPHYERSCFTLVQEVSKLQSNRENVWKSRYDVEEKTTKE